MKNKLKINFKDKKTIIISILLGLILIGLIIFICTKVFHKDKELTPDNPTTKEFEDYLKDAIKPFDEDTIKDFISSTDNVVTVDEIYWGSTYSEDIPLNVKILYTLSRMFFDDSNIVDYMSGNNMFDETTELGDVKLSLKFINKAIAAKFKDTKIEKNTVITDGFFRGVNAVICGDEYCIIPISKSQSKGNDSDGIYNNELSELTKTSDGYEITAEYYYFEIQLSGEMKYNLYDNAFKDTVYCETSIPEMNILGGKLPSRCNDNIDYNKIKYTFDKNYKLVKSEKA